MRSLALALLDDDQGINLQAWKILRDILEDEGDTDIIEAVKIQDDRVYLPSDSGVPGIRPETD